jgi:hypothetical protein
VTEVKREPLGRSRRRTEQAGGDAYVGSWTARRDGDGRVRRALHARASRKRTRRINDGFAASVAQRAQLKLYLRRSAAKVLPLHDNDGGKRSASEQVMA